MDIFKAIFEEDNEALTFLRSLLSSSKRISKMEGFGGLRDGLPPSLTRTDVTCPLRKLLNLNSEGMSYLFSTPVTAVYNITGKDKHEKLRSLYSIAKFRQLSLYTFLLRITPDLDDYDIQTYPCLETAIIASYVGSKDEQCTPDSLAEFYPPLVDEEFMAEVYPGILAIMLAGGKVVADLKVWSTLTIKEKERVAEAAFALASLVSSQGVLDSLCERFPDLAPFLGVLAPGFETEMALALKEPLPEIPYRQAVDELAKAVKSARNADPEVGFANVKLAFEQMRRSSAAEIERIAEANGIKKDKAIEKFLSELERMAETFPWLTAYLSAVEADWSAWKSGDVSTEDVEKTVADLLKQLKATAQEFASIIKALEKAKADRESLAAKEKPASLEARFALLESIRVADLSISDLSLKELHVEAKLQAMLVPPAATKIEPVVLEYSVPTEEAAQEQPVLVEAVSSKPVVREKKSSKVVQLHPAHQPEPERVNTPPSEPPAVVTLQPVNDLVVAIVDGRIEGDLSVAWASLSCSQLAAGAAAAAYQAARVAGNLGYKNSGEFILKALAIGLVVNKAHLFASEFVGACQDAFLAEPVHFHGDPEAFGLVAMAACMAPAFVYHETEDVSALLSEIKLPPKATALHQILNEISGFIRQRVPLSLDIIAEMKHIEDQEKDLAEARGKLESFLDGSNFSGISYAPARNVMRAWVQQDGIIGAPITAAVSGNYHDADLYGFVEQMADKSFVEGCLNRTDSGLRPGIRTSIEYSAKRDIIAFAQNAGSAMLQFLMADRAVKAAETHFYIRTIMESRDVVLKAAPVAVEEMNAIIDAEASAPIKAAAVACRTALKRLPALFSDAPECAFPLPPALTWTGPALEVAETVKTSEIQELLAKAVKGAGGVWRKKTISTSKKAV